MVALFALSLAAVTETRVVFRAPAEQEYAIVRPGGTTILPNGRFLSPKGKRLYGLSNAWSTHLHPDQKRIYLFHDGGYTTYPDWTAAKPIRTTVQRRDPAYCAAFFKDGKRMMISLGEDGAIQIVNAETGAEILTMSANVDGAKLSYVNDLVLSPGEKFCYAVDVANQDLLTFDLELGKLVSRTKAGREPYAIAMNRDGTRLFVANIGLFDYSLIPGMTAQNPGLQVPAFAFPSKEAEEGVEDQGFKVPGLGKADVPDAHSIFAYNLRQPSAPRKVGEVKTGVMIHSLADNGKAVGGSAPCAVLVKDQMLFVSNSNNDTVQVFETSNLKLMRTIKFAPVKELARYRGIIPSSMTINRRGDRLFVCESGINAVAVIDPRSGRFLYHIPTGWWPTSLQLTQDERKLLISTQKGIGRGPRGEKHQRPADDERFGFPDMPSMVDIVTLP
ncbi:MAG: hypothetical protein MUC92_13770, partial [Fimbriimonadaceae bacterium]|nr:hypothetical protein [Fimbriimonadaceae bacterium]